MQRIVIQRSTRKAQKNLKLLFSLHRLMAYRSWKLISPASDEHIRGLSEYEPVTYGFSPFTFHLDEISTNAEVADQKLANGGHIHAAASDILKLF